jgi:hypothetical protein
MTKQEQYQFRLYCQNCTDTQLRNVYALETLARRTAYARIAKAIMQQRGLQ